ncbi:hypothetical protein F441_07123 [Phytophthora nicotianae CJ01A1]|uniref:RNase H type-1 domain-containing protein n=2 Tax=Phytophthora nicotianae TaxID=4792 RepID=W2J750_PHYNI|nr:hypothetical protein L915_06998 [Phytophthora nicotianae]ETL42181.1 hypothetical protein L916_06956 [Phytophthora nicotianae]ETP18676.1 hypothetical protein F441_07123 [Phytophthora nicotianae CJ01A1]
MLEFTPTLLVEFTSTRLVELSSTLLVEFTSTLTLEFTSTLLVEFTPTLPLVLGFTSSPLLVEYTPTLLVELTSTLLVELTSTLLVEFTSTLLVGFPPTLLVELTTTLPLVLGITTTRPLEDDEEFHSALAPEDLDALLLTIDELIDDDPPQAPPAPRAPPTQVPAASPAPPCARPVTTGSADGGTGAARPLPPGERTWTRWGARRVRLPGHSRAWTRWGPRRTQSVPGPGPSTRERQAAGHRTWTRWGPRPPQQPPLPSAPTLTRHLRSKERQQPDLPDDAAATELDDATASPQPPPSSATTGPALHYGLQLFAHDARSFTCACCDYVSIHYGALVRHRRKHHRLHRIEDRFHSGCACAQAFPTRLAAAAHACSCPTASRRPPTQPCLPRSIRPRLRSSSQTPLAPDVHPEGRNSPARTSVMPSVTPLEPQPQPAHPSEYPLEPTATRVQLLVPYSLPTTTTDAASPPPFTAVDEPMREPGAQDTNARRASVGGQEWSLHFDGACRGTKSLGAGAGAILRDDHGTAIWTGSIFLDGRQTNNTAEYQALLAGVEAGVAHGCTSIRIEGDSTLVIAQVKGEFSCKDKRLRNYRNRVRKALASIPASTLVHIDRTDNRIADRLANGALDRHASRFDCANHGVRATPCGTADARPLPAEDVRAEQRCCTSTAFFYAPTSHGGLGLLPLADQLAAIQVGHAWQMLHSPDTTVTAIAREQVVQVARRRYRLDEDYWRERQDELIVAFLQGSLASSPAATRRNQTHDVTSLWSEVQRHVKRLSLTFGIAPDVAPTDATEADDDAPDPPTTPTLTTSTHPEPLERKNVMAQLKLHVKRRYAASWKLQEDKGRTVAAHGGAGSAFLTRSGGLTDRAYRFTVAARLNQLPTRAVLKRRKQGNVTRCRQQGCPQQTETMAHVLNHCTAGNDSIRARHDSVLDSIAAEVRKAKRRGDVELRVNQSVAQAPQSTQRPDLQLVDHDRKRVVLADLVVAFDADAAGRKSTGLDAAHAAKLVKYTPLMRALQQRGWSTTLTAIAYGSLGSVRRSNYATYTETLGLSKRAAKRLDRTCSLTCIRASAGIWYAHAASTNGARRARPPPQTE